MNEVEYIDGIDACFPYNDEKVWKAVIDQGMVISDNAAYMALYEICAAPSEVPQLELQEMFEYWSSKYDPPTKAAAVNAARAFMRGVYLPEEEILKYMDEIAEYPGLYNALGIVWHAAPRDRKWVGTATEPVEQRCREIFSRWKEMTSRQG